ncbi:MAG TPA: alpha/beta hydrolase [Desulfomonilia bacterium]
MEKTDIIKAYGETNFRTAAKLSICLGGFLMIIALNSVPLQAETNWPHMAVSKDGVPISYEIYGAGEPTLVFVHGWSCDSRYWRAQLPYFSKKYRVVVIDLAGHGNSGLSRKDYTMKSFGEDVKAVADAAGGGKVILIGHSMGGSVIAEAAGLMPDNVIGLIGIDTLQDIEYPLTQKELKMMTEPIEKDFRTGSREFIKQMILPGTDKKLSEWILSDISAAPPTVAMSAMNNMMAQYITGDAAKIFDKIRVPVITVDGDMSAINYKANRRHMFSFEAIIIKNADHFLMMDKSDEFNLALDKAIDKLSGKPDK